MFNPEKLLGGLVDMGLNKKMKKGFKKTMKGGLGGTLGSGAKTAIGLGVLGVAMAAFDHYMGQRQQNPGTAGQGQWTPGMQHGMQGAPMQGMQGTGMQPPSGYPGMPAGTPPSPNWGAPRTPPPPPPPMPSAPAPAPAMAATPEPAPEQDQTAVLLIRAMIAAAYADGVLDAEERKRIVGKLEELQLSPEERSFIINELLNPAEMQTLIDVATTPELKQQVYAVSLLAIEVDTEAEKTYLETLARNLGLQPETVLQIHDQLGLDPIA
jgi:hypothetical protein